MGATRDGATDGDGATGASGTRGDATGSGTAGMTGPAAGGATGAGAPGVPGRVVASGGSSEPLDTSPAIVPCGSDAAILELEGDANGFSVANSGADSGVDVDVDDCSAARSPRVADGASTWLEATARDPPSAPASAPATFDALAPEAAKSRLDTSTRPAAIGARPTPPGEPLLDASAADARLPSCASAAEGE